MLWPRVGCVCQRIRVGVLSNRMGRGGIGCGGEI